MATRTTEAELEELVDVLNTRTGRLYVSPRYTRGGLKVYLLGMLEGLDAAR